jgi:hypothetical protein
MRSRTSRTVLTAALTTTLAATVLAGAPLFAQEAAKIALPAPAAVPAREKPVVQIAILLDTSGSMQGLIDQAKSQLWKIVNEFARAKGPGGMRPDIQVALYQYGTPSLGAENGYIRQLVPLTDDLDKISEELFKLTTDGGDEYCGAVIQKAADELQWSGVKSAYKAIFIAGNEPFTQGSVNYSEACKKAVSKGIIVNTIYCGPERDGAQSGWKDGAALADGAFMTIDQNRQVVHIEAPQDKEIAELGQKINGTYVGYGRAGQAGAQNQAAQDSNAFAAGAGRGGGGRGIAVERAVTKSSAAYNNAGWDLVDATRQNRVALKELKAEDLPEEMRNLDEKGREAYLAKKAEERTAIQAKIQQLNADREKFLAEKRKETPASTLDAAIIGAVRSQATKNGMAFEQP